MVELHDGDVFSTPSGKTYEVLTELGKGGFGVVHLVKEVSTGIERVVKVPNYEKPGDLPAILPKHTMEAQIIEDLAHKGVPDVVKYVDFVDCNIKGTMVPVLIIEKAPGCTLEDWIKTNGKMPEDGVKVVLERLGIAMKHVHYPGGYIHRDLKPQNIFIDGDLSDPILTIIDFGISATFDNSKTHCVVTNKMGTNYFAPPEQMTHNEARESTDTFALGAIAFNLLTGHHPSLCGRNVKYRPKEYEASVSDDFNKLVEKATWDKPVHRYHTMDDFVLQVRGKPLVENMPHIIAEGSKIAIDSDEIWIVRRTTSISDRHRIQVTEHTDPSSRTFFLSRWHAVIRTGSDGVPRLFDKGVNRPAPRESTTASSNGTVWRVDATQEWREVPESGLALANKFYEIGLGYTKHPTDHADKDGNPILPGAYRTITYVPPVTSTV